MNPLSSNSNSDVAKYFTKMGYEYTWDFSRQDGLHWHEILGPNGELVFQVEMGVPIKQIVKDLCTIEDIHLDYFIASKNQKTYDAFCKKVREYERSRANERKTLQTRTKK